MMKLPVLALAAACALGLAACDDPQPVPPTNTPGPIDECGPGPQPTGQPCP